MGKSPKSLALAILFLLQKPGTYGIVVINPDGQESV
jgi:hypothetical protein